MSPGGKTSFSWTISGARDRQNNSILDPGSFKTVKDQKLSTIKDDEFTGKKQEFVKENKEKSQKFGNFMGKLLLKSRVNNNKHLTKAPKENLKQRALTDEPYAGLFRVRKTRLDQQQMKSQLFSGNKVKFSLTQKNNDSSTKEGKCNENNLKSKDMTVPKYRIANGRKTRWDIKGPNEEYSSNPVEIQEENNPGDIYNSEKNNNKNRDTAETCSWEHKAAIDIPGNTKTVSLSENDDSFDCDSLDSLQSDDDVLGPWIELGMIDANILNKSTTSARDNHRDCEECIENTCNMGTDRQPLETVDICENCRTDWKVLLEGTFKKSRKGQESSSLEIKQKPRKKAKLNHIASKNTNGRKKQPVSNTLPKSQPTRVPPTTSRYQQKTNSKIAKDKKAANFTVIENTNSSGNKGNKGGNHVTTGAFMTRKTAQELADPEYGFYPNPYGFLHKQRVEVLNLNGRWYSGTLEMMDRGKVKVRYAEWDGQEEWVIMGSRRLKSLPADQQTPLVDNQLDADEVVDVTTVSLEDTINPSSRIKHSSSHFPVDEIDLTDITQLFKESNYQASSKNAQADYVSDMLDKDPTQIFNNNEVFMTRRMARELTDEYGFKPNSFGYRRNRGVAITFHAKRKGERKIKSECIAFLREMRLDQIRVWYPDLHISEWLPIGSRRLRVLSEEEEITILSKTKVDLNVKEVPTVTDNCSTTSKKPPMANTKKPKNRKYNADVVSSNTSNGHDVVVAKTSKNRLKKPISKPVQRTLHTRAIVNNITESIPIDIMPSSSADNITENKIEANDHYLTTGAFATRRAMRQLKDDHGFTPNPYGYTYNLAVEVLNIRSGKLKFWERGTLVAMKPGQVKVHYEGWADIYDEWLMVGSRRIRVFTAQDNNVDGDKQNGITSETEVNRQQETSSKPPNATLATDFANNLLMTEMNPEVNLKKNRKHTVVGAQDYQKLGLLISIEELAAKEAKKQERRENLRKLRLLNKEKNTANSTATVDFIDDNYESESDKDESDHDDYKNNSYGARSTKKKHRKKHKQRQLLDKKTNPSKKSHIYQKLCKHHCNTSNPKEISNDQSSGVDARSIQTISLRLAQAEASKKHEFVANVYGYDYMQHVTVLHLDKKLYEGRLVRMGQNKVKVHYCGYIDSFDEEIPLGSRRIQPIENDHEVECLEPTYRQRYEQIIQNTPLEECSECTESQKQSKQQIANKLNRKRLTLDDVYSDHDSENGNAEYHKEDEDMVETKTWKVYCNQCNVVIKQFRYFCTYCETPSQGYDYQSFELCLRCFDQNFPFWHEHPRSSFAIQSVIDTEIGPRPIKGELVTVWEEDILEDTTMNNHEELNSNSDQLNSMIDNLNISENITDQATPVQEVIVQKEPDTQPSSTAVISHVEEATQLEISKIFTGNETIEANQGHKYLKKWKRRKICAFCNDDDDTSEELGQFIGPFVIATFNKNGVEKKRSFWAHDSCARYSPEVFCTPEGKWYNVTLALRRGRGMRCHVCKEKGATIGCFESKCSKSFHLPCSQKPVTYFQNGVIFWCNAHEAYYNKIDTYVNVFNCDGCSKQLTDESWFTCVPCSSSYFKSFDLCAECYEKFPTDHDHNEDQFEETSFAILKEMEAQKATEAAKEKEDQVTKKKKKPLFPRRRRKLPDGTLPVSCCYCGTYDSDEWRKGYEGGVIMCSKCFKLAVLLDNDGKEGDMPLVIDNFDSQHQDQHLYAASIEDYSHKPYLTRDALSLSKFSESSTGSRLASYEPQPNQFFSLSFDSTYFDIPGRAPRWATHSGTDYHGTWLPQTVRRAILKHTSKDERVLSNFLGRGTDAIECFLLQRSCCGIDINPAAVALSQRNCCFEIPPGLTSAEYRPIIAQADSRQLSGALFTNESYHHILSHPPYKDCVAYSTHLEGDLSRYTNVEDFKVEYTKVVKESYRLLKMGRRLTLGIGDNREHCFYIPVGFHLIRLYVDQGFELEELVIKRQRYCSAFGLGTYLCVQFDFLVFTHEFIATFKKVPKECTNKMEIDRNDNLDVFRFKTTRYGIPSSAIMRKSVVMGTVWVFKPTETYKFEQLCISRMVERFGRDEGNWDHISLELCQEGHNEATLNETNSTDTNPTNADDRTTEESTSSESISEYERKRLKRIEENNKTLLKLGLISELSEESEDIVHHDLMFSKEVYPDGDLVLMVTGHIPNLQPHKINSYRSSLIQLARDATVKLTTKGFLIIGTQDIRDPISGKLWPMTMLVLEDIEREVGRDVIKLKEMVVAVPEGYSKDRKKVFTPEELNQDEEEIIDIETIEDDHLPIVHAIYLIFQKL